MPYLKNFLACPQDEFLLHPKKIVELSSFCEKITAEDEKSIGLKEIGSVSDQRRFTNGTISGITSLKRKYLLF